MRKIYFIICFIAYETPTWAAGLEASDEILGTTMRTNIVRAHDFSASKATISSIPATPEDKASVATGMTSMSTLDITNLQSRYKALSDKLITSQASYKEKSRLLEVEIGRREATEALVKVLNSQLETTRISHAQSLIESEAKQAAAEARATDLQTQLTALEALRSVDIVRLAAAESRLTEVTAQFATQTAVKDAEIEELRKALAARDATHLAALSAYTDATNAEATKRAAAEAIAADKTARLGELEAQFAEAMARYTVQITASDAEVARLRAEFTAQTVTLNSTMQLLQGAEARANEAEVRTRAAEDTRASAITTYGSLIEDLRSRLSTAQTELTQTETALLTVRHGEKHGECARLQAEITKFGLLIQQFEAYSEYALKKRIAGVTAETIASETEVYKGILRGLEDTLANATSNLPHSTPVKTLIARVASEPESRRASNAGAGAAGGTSSHA